MTEHYETRGPSQPFFEFDLAEEGVAYVFDKPGHIMQEPPEFEEYGTDRVFDSRGRSAGLGVEDFLVVIKRWSEQADIDRFDTYLRAAAARYLPEEGVSKLTTVELRDRLEPVLRRRQRQHMLPRSSIGSLILGIVSLFAWLIPVAGFPVSIVALVLGWAGRKRHRDGLSTAGLVASGIGLTLTLINSAAAAYIGAGGHLFDGRTPSALSSPSPPIVPIFLTGYSVSNARVISEANEQVAFGFNPGTPPISTFGCRLTGSTVFVVKLLADNQSAFLPGGLFEQSGARGIQMGRYPPNRVSAVTLFVPDRTPRLVASQAIARLLVSVFAMKRGSADVSIRHHRNHILI